MFLGQGFVKAIVQRKDLEDEHLNTAFWANIITGLLLTAIVFAIAPFVAQQSGQPELSSVLRWLSLSFIISSFANVQNAQLQRSFEYKKLAFRTMLGLFVGGGIGVVMAFMGYGVWSLVAQQLVSSGLSTVALWFMSPWRPGLSFSPTHFSDLFGFEANSFGIRALNLINRRSDDLLVGFFLGPVALGLYSMAYRIYFIIAELFSSSLNSVSFSALSRTQEDIPKTRNAFYSLVEMVSLVSLPAFVGLAFLAPSVVPMLLGDGWERSIRVLQILCAVGVIQAVAIFNFTVISALNKPQWEFRYNLLSAAINLVSFFIAVRYGIVAVAAAYTIRAYVLIPLSLIAVKRLIDIRYRDYLKLFLPPLVGTTVMLGVLYGLSSVTQDVPDFLRAALLVVGGGLSYLGAVRIFAPELARKILDLILSVGPGKRLQRNA